MALACTGHATRVHASLPPLDASDGALRSDTDAIRIPLPHVHMRLCDSR